MIKFRNNKVLSPKAETCKRATITQFPPAPIITFFCIHSFTIIRITITTVECWPTSLPLPVHTFFMSAHAVEGGLGEGSTIGLEGEGRAWPSCGGRQKETRQATARLLYLSKYPPSTHSGQNQAIKCSPHLTTWPFDSERNSLKILLVSSIECPLQSGNYCTL